MEKNNDQQNFLATVGYLSRSILSSLIRQIVDFLRNRRFGNRTLFSVRMNF